MNFIDLIEKRFHYLVVIERLPNNKFNQVVWRCKCDCGNITKVITQYLKKGNIKSCGCFGKEIRLKHGHSYRGKWSRTYQTWQSMKNRCINPKYEYYKDYGGRNPPITVCDRWLSENNGFQNFLEDMSERPIGRTLDRINNNKGYFKENCKWSTPEQQNRNMRSNINISLNGKLLCLKDYCKIKNLNYNTVSTRLFRGLSLKKSLTTPIESKQKRSLSVINYEKELRSSLNNLIRENKNEISFSKDLPYNSKQLCNHLESVKLNQSNCCPMCNVSYDINSSDIDHIIPTSTAKTKEGLLKLFDLNNLSLLCYKCNRYVKRARLDIRYNYGFDCV